MLPSSADDCIPRHFLGYIPNQGTFKRACTFCRVLPHLSYYSVCELCVGVVFAPAVKALLSFCNDLWTLFCDKGVITGRALAISTYLLRLLPVDAGNARAAGAFWAVHSEGQGLKYVVVVEA